MSGGSNRPWVSSQIEVGEDQSIQLETFGSYFESAATKTNHFVYIILVEFHNMM